MVVVGMKYIASVSFGKDSLAMLLRIMEEKLPLDIVVFYNTGMEFEAIYHIRDEITPLLSKHGVEFVELQPAEPFLYSMLERKVVSKQKESTSGMGGAAGFADGEQRRRRQRLRSSSSLSMERRSIMSA